MNTEQAKSQFICPKASEQTRRAYSLLDLANTVDSQDTKFTLQLGALHLARAIPEYWYTTADQIPPALNLTGKEADQLCKRLRNAIEEIFRGARRYELVTSLRSWDFHWEPLINPKLIGPNGTYGRGAPMQLSTGAAPNSSVYYVGGANRIITTGSGRRVGRTNYYQIQKSRFVDFDRSEAVPLALAIREFLDDIPNCIQKIVEIQEIKAFISQERG